MPLINDKSAKYPNTKGNFKTLYFDYIQQVNCNPNYKIQGGSGGTNAESVYLNIQEGKALVTCSEIQCAQSNSCLNVATTNYTYNY
jgi:hypothetical protein